ncbi:MAG TPA: transposase, partial [Pseudonocardiaceae bacterium]
MPTPGTFRYASRRYWDELSKDLKPIYQAPTAQAAAAALDALEDKWGARYPAMIQLWRTAWAEFIPFLDYGGCCGIRVSGGGGRWLGREILWWPSRSVRCCVTSRCFFRWICVSGCRRITWCGSCSMSSTPWTPLSWSGAGAAVGPARPGMTRGCCSGCWCTPTARGC